MCPNVDGSKCFSSNTVILHFSVKYLGKKCLKLANYKSALNILMAVFISCPDTGLRVKMFCKYIFDRTSPEALR